MQPCVSGVVEREAQLARACKTFAAGLAVQHQEVPQYPMPAGDPDQIDLILDRAQQEFRVAALLSGASLVLVGAGVLSSESGAIESPWGAARGRRAAKARGAKE